MDEIAVVQLLAIVYCLYIALRRAWAGWQWLRLSRILPNLAPQDASTWQLEPPALVGTLVTMGFRQLGQTYVDFHAPRKSIPSWILVDSSGTVQAEVAGTPPTVAFLSAYADETLVETSFPEGTHLETPTFRSHIITGSLTRAYEHQLQEAAAWSGAHGAVQTVATLQDYLHWEEVYRRRHVQRKLQWSLMLNGILPQVLLLYHVVTVAVALLLLPWKDLRWATAAPHIATLFWLSLAGNLLTELRWRIYRWSRRRDSAKGLAPGGL